MGIKGKFITFEGSEGSGKSTQIRMLAAYLESKGKKVLVLREPGGVRISEDIRDILLDIKNKNMTDICETLLYMAARAQIVEEVIAPALRRGTIVLCDRFWIPPWRIRDTVMGWMSNLSKRWGGW